MQLMPATARWVAKKIGLEDFHPSRVNDTDVNVLLGTSYMRMVMENLDNHPVLASAAYNAGPGRARRWRSEQAIEGAIYAETIPFTETRDYVKKVMSNTQNFMLDLAV
jgi:soluble lytic murein transglycosylase